MQRWIGTVVSFDGEIVHAKLEDQTDPTYPLEFAEIRLEKMYGCHRHLRRRIKPGARFIWTIRVKRVGRHKEKVTSEFYFPYVGKWTRRDLKKIKREMGKFDTWFTYNHEGYHQQYIEREPVFMYKENTVIPSQEFPTRRV